MTLQLQSLPKLPQMDLLAELSRRLWESDEAVAIWLGGSFGSGKADRYSDVDLRVAVNEQSLAAWQSPNFDAVFGRPNVDAWTSISEDDAVLHHLLLDNAEMYDLWIQTPSRELHQEPKLVLGCRDDQLAQRLAAPSHEPRLAFNGVVPQQLARALGMYWACTGRTTSSTKR